MTPKRTCTLVIALLGLLSPSAGQTSDTPITLSVRVHLIRSATHPRLHASLDEPAIRSLFEEVNEIWAQACVRFELDSIGTLRALDIPPKKWFERDRNWVKSAIPTSQFSPDAIDLCFVHDMGPNGFFYGEPVVVCETPEFTKVKDGARNAVARVIAHELGHVLWLQHRQDHTNLMASGRNGISLNKIEIKDARKRALEICAHASVQEIPQ